VTPTPEPTETPTPEPTVTPTPETPTPEPKLNFIGVFEDPRCMIEEDLPLDTPRVWRRFEDDDLFTCPWEVGTDQLALVDGDQDVTVDIVPFGDDEDASIISEVVVDGQRFDRPAPGITLSWNIGPHTLLAQRGSCVSQGPENDICWNLQAYIVGKPEGLLSEMFATIAAMLAAQQ
jgi:hypothetical protein